MNYKTKSIQNVPIYNRKANRNHSHPTNPSLTTHSKCYAQIRSYRPRAPSEIMGRETLLSYGKKGKEI